MLHHAENKIQGYYREDMSNRTDAVIMLILINTIIINKKEHQLKEGLVIKEGF